MSDAPDRFDLVVRGNRVLTVDGVSAAAVAVRDGRIAAIQPVDADLAASSSVELRSDEVLIPGLVDTHVHVNDPGRTEWEGFATATRAAAAGGITTIVDMPLNSVPPTVDPTALETKRAVAEGQVHVDVGFWGGAVPDSLGRLRELHDGGVLGFKCFLVPSGVDEFPHLSREQLAVAVREVAELDALLVVHAEDADVIGSAPPPAGRRYADFLASRPPTAEDSAVEHLAALVRDAGARAHVLHLSSAGALPTLAAARSEGVRLTAETCPHYLTLVADDVPAGATQFKCCPPIRDDDNRGRLWQGLADGLLDCVVSDHSPCTPDLKCLDTGDFGAAWGGIASLQLGLPVVWTHAASRGFGLTDVVRWMATGPADLVGLASKGRIEVGADADLCVFAPDAAWTVDPGALHHRNKVTPYAGMELLGEVRSTWLRGERVTGEAPAGRLLSRAG